MVGPRGLGVSEADGDEWCRLDNLLAEIDAVADAALAGGQHHVIHLIGHCFGAIVALLYAALMAGPSRQPGACHAGALPRTISTRAPSCACCGALIRRRAERIAIPLSPDDFSELVPFVELVRGDPLVLRTAPARLFYEIRRARRRLPAAARALRAPLLAAMAGDDPICDNRRNNQVLERVNAEKQLRTYTGARHILEFSGARGAFLDDLAAWYRSQESA